MQDDDYLSAFCQHTSKAQVKRKHSVGILYKYLQHHKRPYLEIKSAEDEPVQKTLQPYDPIGLAPRGSERPPKLTLTLGYLWGIQSQPYPVPLTVHGGLWAGRKMTALCISDTRSNHEKATLHSQKLHLSNGLPLLDHLSNEPALNVFPIA